MIIISDDGATRVIEYADTNVVSSKGRIELTIIREVWRKLFDESWIRTVQEVRERVVVDDNMLLDGDLRIQDSGTPGFTLITGLTAAEVGLTDGPVFAAVAAKIEAFLLANGYVIV